MADTEQWARTNYLNAFLKHYKKCLLVPVILGVAGFFAAMLLPKQYRAEAAVAVTNVDFGATQMKLRGVPVKGLLSFFRSGELIEAVMAEFQLDEAPHNYTRYRFHREVLDVKAPREAEVIEIQVKLSSPELASNVANFIAKEGVENYTNQMKSQHESMLEELNGEASTKETELQEADEKLEDFHAKKKIETLRSRMAVQQNLLIERETRRAEIERELPAVVESIKSYEDSLAKEDKVIELKRSLTDNPLLQQALAKQTGKGVEDLLRLSVAETVLNPVYFRIAGELIDARAKRAAFQAELTAIRKAAQDAEKLLVELRKELAGREKELRELGFKREQARAAASMSLEKLQDKKTVGMWPPHRLTVIRASVPDAPYLPKKGMIALVVLLVSLVGMWALAIFLEARSGNKI